MHRLEGMHVRPAGWNVVVRALATGTLLAAVAGCAGIQQGRQWTLQAIRPDGAAYPVVIRDVTGRIVDALVDPPGARPAAYSNPGGQPNVVAVPWTGGACDARTQIDITSTPTGLSLTVDTARDGGACILLGVEHMLVLTALGPIDPMTVIVGTRVP